MTATSTVQAQVDENQFIADAKFLSSQATRMPGTPGYVQAATYIQNQISSLNNVQIRQQRFNVMVPFTESATIVTPSRGLEYIYPLWPAGIRLNATPPNGITGQLIYCKDADLKDIHPAELSGQIAVLETTSGQNWSLAMQMGAQAILLLGSPDTNNIDLRTHDVAIPVNFPRFYVPPGPLADALRGRGAGRLTGQATLKASVSWRKVEAYNYFVLVKPVSAHYSGASPPALGITVPFDSSSIVPDLGPGASQALQTASGLGLLRGLSARPPGPPGCYSVLPVPTAWHFRAVAICTWPCRTFLPPGRQS